MSFTKIGDSHVACLGAGPGLDWWLYSIDWEGKRKFIGSFPSLNECRAHVAFDMEAAADDETCPACGGELALLGQLGSRQHFRCRDCGIDSSKKEEK